MEYRFDSRDPRMRHLHFTSPPLTSPMEVRMHIYYFEHVYRAWVFLPYMVMHPNRLSSDNPTSTPPKHTPQVTGFPRATLWVSSSAVDASLFLYLLCVDHRASSLPFRSYLNKRQLLQQQQDIGRLIY